MKLSYKQGGLSQGWSSKAGTSKVLTEVICSGILPTSPHVENRCEINPSHMAFMIFNFCTIYLA